MTDPQDNTMNAIDEILWYIERGYLIDEVKTNSDIRKQAKQALLQLLNEAKDKYKDYKSPQEVSALLNKAMVDTRAFLKGELTPKENK